MIEACALSAEKMLNGDNPLREALTLVLGDKLDSKRLGIWLSRVKGQIVGHWRLHGSQDRRDITHWWMRAAKPPEEK